jgi:hypothetical protein
MRHPLSWALIVAALATLSGIGRAASCAHAATPSTAETSRPDSTDDQSLEVFFHPIGLSSAIGLIVPNPDPNSGSSVNYPNGTSGGNGNDGGSGGNGGNGSGPGGGNPSSGSPNGTPEPATLLSAAIGAGMLGLYGWRRRRS